MNSLTKEEYLKLLEEVSSYDTAYEDELPSNWMDDAWIPGEPAIKEQIKKSISYGKYDITKLKKSEIGLALLKYHDVVVGDFLIRIDKISHGNNPVTHLDIEIWEKKYRTPNGFPCNIDSRVNLYKDNRFNQSPWIHDFNTIGEAKNLIIARVVEIIKWLQAAKRISAFM